MTFNTIYVIEKDPLVMMHFQLLLLVYVANFICMPLCNVFNLSLDQGIDPACMKIARIVPIFKSEGKELVINYRPLLVPSMLV